MGRIEEALAKLQAQRAVLDGPVAPPRPIGKVREASSVVTPKEHTYGGKHIEIDAGELRVQGLLAPDNQERQLADEYRSIKRPLLKNAHAAREPVLPHGNLLMIASALSGEGKTFTCLNLCLSIAREQDWSVVLVDGDCSKPHLTRLFGAGDEPGLIDLLRKPDVRFESLVMPTNVSGLSLLPAGARDERASELLSSARMSSLCEEISVADPQRIVIFDSAPLLLTSESPILASHMGQVVMVVHANKTPQRAVLEARDRLDSTKAVNLLLNQTSARNGAAGYGEYGEYYGYAD